MMKKKQITAMLLSMCMAIPVIAGIPAAGTEAKETTASPKYIFLFIGDGMSYPQIQTTADYLGTTASD
ncbi:hypothetical protein VPJ68_01095, partial [Parabacteroides distasonis]